MDAAAAAAATASADMKYSPPAAPLSASSAAAADSSSLVGPGFEVIAPPPNYHQAVDVDTGELCRQDSKEPPPINTTAAAAAAAAVVQRDFEFKEVAITATKAEQLNDRDVGGYHSIHLSQLIAYDIFRAIVKEFWVYSIAHVFITYLPW